MRCVVRVKVVRAECNIAASNIRPIVVTLFIVDVHMI